jgi:3-oxosteroid 1-dehydrogenase
MANSTWDQEFDVIVAGSGAGGMTAALCAAGEGLSAVVLESTGLYGGTSAVSGGGIWIPCNDQMAGHGVPDTEAEALTYLRHLTRGEVPAARLEAYVRNAREMVRHMEQAFGVRFESVAKYPDYFCDEPGGKPGARTMQPAAFDAAQLGDEFFRQREPYKGTLVLGRIAMDQVQAHTLFSRGPGWVWLMLKLMWSYWTDFAWRRKTWRDRHQVLGQGLVAALRHAMLQHKVPLMLGLPLAELVVEGGRVAGVVALREGRKLRLRARRAVVLATGGFEASQPMRQAYLPEPTLAAWSAAPGTNFGDGIRAGKDAGAALAFMNLTWGTPTTPIPGAPNASPSFVDRSLPGCIVVNKAGKRFVNEAAPYTEFVYAMIEDQARTGSSIPCWMIVDGAFRKKYPLGPILPSGLQPDAKLPRDWADKVYYKADTLEALAQKIGVDGEGLAASVARMNEYARSGEDPEFSKGKSAFDRYYADPRVKPNPCLGPIAQAPFYAVPLYPGEIGTKGGLVTDERARVLREDGTAIAGLYAIGNCSAAVMGRTYAGPGATLGPAMTFAYIAARDIAASAVAAARAA